MQFEFKDHSNELLLKLYEGLLKPRMVEEKMLVLLRQNKISKWFSGIGQEAISIGLALALRPNDYILPMHRNLGVFTGREVALERLLAQFQGKVSGYTKGRDRSFHFGSKAHHIIGMISHLGAQMGVADGIALGALLKNDQSITAVFTGDGGASEGDFHEAINVAAVWDLPVIFVVENNGYGLSTPSSEQFRCKQFLDKAIGYGIEGIQVDGNNVLAVYDAVRSVAASMREKPRPILLECMTFRMRGHEEASGTKYIPMELLEQWGKKDPLKCYEDLLLEQKILNPDRIEEIKNEIKTEIENAIKSAFAEEDIIPITDNEVADLYAPAPPPILIPPIPHTEKRFIDAIRDTMQQALQKHPNLILMGQDIAEYGGVFKATEGLLETFGKARIRNTPLCESAIIGAGLGLSIAGYKALIEMQFADFISCGFNQVINNLAKTHYRWGQAVDVVIRMPTGAGSGAGPFHSQSKSSPFFRTQSFVPIPYRFCS
jgi:2-oxoisovalerate dehydrogenase E1 component